MGRSTIKYHCGNGNHNQTNYCSNSRNGNSTYGNTAAVGEQEFFTRGGNALRTADGLLFLHEHK